MARAQETSASGTERAVPPRYSPPAPLGLVASLVALGTGLACVALTGLWDPPELRNAEFARRIAHDLLGASGFAASATEPVLTREALGRGELPFLSMALGLRLFGLSTWAGRAVLALWGLLGLGALHVLVRRLSSARAGWLAVLALATMPLYFIGSRSLLGDVVSMAANSLATSGLLLCVFDVAAGRRRAVFLVLGLLGLLCGLLSRGLSVGVAAPLLAVGLAWLLLALVENRGDRGSDAVGIACLSLGVFTAVASAVVLARTPDETYSLWLGATPFPVRPQPTFDVVVRDLGHASFPWSALVLPAAGRLLHARRDIVDLRSQGLRFGLLATVLTMCVTQTVQSEWLGVQAFAAPAAIAAICALALDDLGRSAEPSRWFGASVAAMLLLLLLDFRNFPEKGLVAFAADDAVFPARFAEEGFAWLAVAALPLTVLFFLLVEDDAVPLVAGTFRRREYLRWPRILRRVWGGNLWFAVLAVGSACAAFDLIRFVGERLLHLSVFDGMSTLSRALVHAGWGIAMALGLGPALVMTVRDGVRLLIEAPARHSSQRLLPLSRGGVALFAFALSATVLSFGYYIALAQELSPKRSFELYRHSAPAGASLGLLGVSARVARYEAGARGKELRDADEASAFLLAGNSPRFLAVRANELAGVNAVFRAATNPRRNLPVLDSHGGEIVLAANQLPAGRSDDNPFADWIQTGPPKPQHVLDVDLGGKLTALGWDVLDMQHQRVAAIETGVDYQFALYYRVEQRLAGNWDTFLHIDGFQRRFNGDHATLGGHYPFPLWLVGDYMVDRHTFRLGPEFSRGRYRVYFGLYSGSRRLQVRHGEHQDDRVVAGTIEVK